jgi:hypothetical protein
MEKTPVVKYDTQILFIKEVFVREKCLGLRCGISNSASP